MAKSTAPRARSKSDKPAKPYPKFPCYAHASGRWAAKVKGRTHFFGRWGVKDGPRIVPVDDVFASAEAADEEYKRQVFYLLKGETPPPLVSEEEEEKHGADLWDLREKFLDAHEHRVTVGKLSPQTFAGYKRGMKLLVDFFGEEKPLASLNPEAFTKFYKHLDRGQNPTSLSNDIRHIKIALKYAYDAELVDRPFRYGPDFKKPAQKEVRAAEQEHERKHGKRMFEAKDLRTILDALDGKGKHKQPQTPRNIMGRAWVLLGINCGFGPSDLSGIEPSHFDLKAGWVNYPRPKTRVPRRIPLWPETVAAVRKALAVRPDPADEEDDSRAFLTVTGLPLVNITTKGHATDAVGKWFGLLLDELGLRRLRLNHYALRHNCETIGQRTRDGKAVDRIMGHAADSSDMSEKYIEDFEAERLLNVTNTIREWLFEGSKEP